MKHTFASISLRAEKAAQVTGLEFSQIGVIRSQQLLVHGLKKFTQAEALNLATALGGLDPAYKGNPDKPDCPSYGTVSARTADGIEVTVFCRYEPEDCAAGDVHSGSDGDA